MEDAVPAGRAVRDGQRSTMRQVTRTIGRTPADRVVPPLCSPDCRTSAGLQNRYSGHDQEHARRGSPATGGQRERPAPATTGRHRPGDGQVTHGLMYHERIPHDAHRPNHPQYLSGQTPFPEGNAQPSPHAAEFTSHTDGNIGPHPADAYAGPLAPPGADWDPAAELASLLQGAEEWQQPTDFHEDKRSPQPPAAGPPQEGPHRVTVLPGRRRRPRRRARRRAQVSPLRLASLTAAALAAVIASSVSLLGGMASYEPLRLTAVAQASDGVVSWWPMLVYGPWLVASLAVLRAALHRRRAVHSWAVVLLFSGIAMLLCVLQAPRTPADAAAASLPGLASLVCFQQAVRQITLSRPPRRAAPRHHRQAKESRSAASGVQRRSSSGPRPVEPPQGRAPRGLRDAPVRRA